MDSLKMVIVTQELVRLLHIRTCSQLGLAMVNERLYTFQHNFQVKLQAHYPVTKQKSLTSAPLFLAKAKMGSIRF